MRRRLVTINDLRRDAFRLFDECEWLRFLLLTKRPDNVRRMWPAIDDATASMDASLANHFSAVAARVKAGWLFGNPSSEAAAYDAHKVLHPYRDNVWLGTSCSEQASADAVIPELRKCRDLAPVLFLSCEPLLGPIDLSRWMSGFEISRDEDSNDLGSGSGGSDIGLVIVGGESGPGARPCELTWIRDLIRQCQEANVPIFVKQLGDKPSGNGGCIFSRNIWGPKGHDIDRWPEDLRVRQMPKVPGRV